MVRKTTAKRERIYVPSFKTRTIHFNPHNLEFWVDVQSLKEGIIPPSFIEFGTSMSLDGCYLDSPAFMPGITIAFPININKDLPKFYIYPFGQFLYNRYILDSPTFFHEMEVKYPDSLYLNEALFATIHISEKDIELIRKKRKAQRHHVKMALDVLSIIRRKCKIVNDIPITTFRRNVQKITPIIKDLEIPRLSDSLTKWKNWYNKVIKLMKPINMGIAKAYRINYRSLINETWELIKEDLRR